MPDIFSNPLLTVLFFPGLSLQVSVLSGQHSAAAATTHLHNLNDCTNGSVGPAPYHYWPQQQWWIVNGMIPLNEWTVPPFDGPWEDWCAAVGVNIRWHWKSIEILSFLISSQFTHTCIVHYPFQNAVFPWLHTHNPSSAEMTIYEHLITFYRPKYKFWKWIRFF